MTAHSHLTVLLVLKLVILHILNLDVITGVLVDKKAMMCQLAIILCLKSITVSIAF
jgi:hypothetical protein